MRGGGVAAAEAAHVLYLRHLVVRISCLVVLVAPEVVGGHRPRRRVCGRGRSQEPGGGRHAVVGVAVATSGASGGGGRAQLLVNLARGGIVLHILGFRLDGMFCTKDRMI